MFNQLKSRLNLEVFGQKPPSPVASRPSQAKQAPPQKSPEEIADELRASLDMGFYTKDFDAPAHFLASFPMTTKGDDLEQYFEKEMSQLDLVKDQILAELSDHVQSKYELFIEGMRNVQEVSMLLTKSNVNVANGRRKLAGARDSLVQSHLAVVKKKRGRDRMQHVVNLIRGLRDLFRAEKAMERLMADG